MEINHVAKGSGVSKGSARERAQAFLEQSHAFRLGDLVTEQPHPLSTDLSAQAMGDTVGCLETLRAIDLQALNLLKARLGHSVDLARAIRSCFVRGGRVFLAGCGATGRLSLALETFAREGMLGDAFRDRVVGFMAGGDAALIRSIEGFEDLPGYGRRQLLELGFGEHDLLIASTEGGETPWVIGATEAAAEMASDELRPWFCYCNPDTVLDEMVERSRRVLRNPKIAKWNLTVGPMAVAGSTRMQASTVLMLGIGLSLLGAVTDEEPSLDKIAGVFSQFKNYFGSASWSEIALLVKKEAALCERNERVVYVTNGYGLTVLTDTTERAPTFSLVPFENALAESDLRSLSYLRVPGVTDINAAWHHLLRRAPRCLEWEECRRFTGREWLSGYGIDGSADLVGAAEFKVDKDGDGISLCLQNCSAWLPLPDRSVVNSGAGILFENVLLKCVLNAHSTAVMGRLGRYEGNLMTYVKASNCKLIDRAIRYVRQLAVRSGHAEPTYEETCLALFEEMETLRPNEPVVLKTLERLVRK